MEDDTTMTHHLLGLATKNLEATHKKFQDGARRLKTSPEAMATTFCLLVVTPGWYFGCQVGDGTIVTRRRGAPDYATLLQPTKGDHANETTLFPQNIAKQTSEGWIMDTSHLSLRFERESLDFFCLSTDGIDTVAFLKPQWQPSSGFFKPLEDHARETTSRRKLTQDLHQFLKSSSLRRRSDDDRTMVIGCHKEPT